MENDIINRILIALTNKGSRPKHHDYIMRQLKSTWPILYNALMELVEVRKDHYPEIKYDIG